MVWDSNTSTNYEPNVYEHEEAIGFSTQSTIVHDLTKVKAGLVKLWIGNYACAMVMFSKNDIFGNWTEEKCGNYCLVKKN